MGHGEPYQGVPRWAAPRPIFSLPPFYSAFATNSHSTKLCNLFFCAPAARAPTFPCVEKWAKDAKEGVFRLPPSLHLPRNDQREFPLWNSPPPHALRCFGAFSNLSSFCIRLLFIQCFSKRPRRANESFRPPFSKGGGAEGQSPPRPPQRAKHLLVHKAQERRQTSRWDVWRGRTLAGGSPMRLLPHFFFAPFYSAFVTNSHSTKL